MDEEMDIDEKPEEAHTYIYEQSNNEELKQEEEMESKENEMIQAHPPSLYELIVQQLNRDGLIEEANAVKAALEGGKIPTEHRADQEQFRLDELVEIALQKRENEPKQNEIGVEDTVDVKEDINELENYCIDLQADKKSSQRRNFHTRFVVTHKQGVRSVRFSRCGKYAATGSKDTSIKVLEVAKLRERKSGEPEVKPVLRSLYEHTGTVHDVDFHPTSPVLASGSRDCTIKFFDFLSSSKRAFRSITDTHPVRSLHFHPRGDFMIVGTLHSMIRTYDVHRMEAYTSSRPTDHHYARVSMVRYSPDGRLFASSSFDGTIKIWDAITGRCERYIPKAHSGKEVNSVHFSKNGLYLLSSGKDSSVRLWDLGAAKQVKRYGGATMAKSNANAIFDFHEDFVFCIDESKFAVLVWDARTGEIVQRLQGHNNNINRLDACPTEPGVISASADNRARYWYGKVIERNHEKNS